MEVYFDKENLISYIGGAKDSRFNNCNETLKNHCKVLFNFSKDSLSSDEKEIVSTWLTRCSDGFSSSNWIWGDVFPPRPIKSTTPNDFMIRDFSSVYLISDEHLDSWKSKAQFLIASCGEEIDTLSQLWFEDRQYQINIFDRVDSWARIEPYRSPSSDIIIADPYILWDISLVDSNLLALLKVLSGDTTFAKMNIVVFTLFDEKDPCYEKTCWTVLNRIKEELEYAKQVKPAVSLIAVSQSAFKEHDRTILTNYKLLSSGDTFNYFNSAGEKITNGRYLNVISLVTEANMQIAESFVKDMQSIYDHNMKYCPEHVYKDKNSRSNFITIE